MIKNPQTIAAFFINFLFVVGVILLVVGFIRSLRLAAYTLLFDQYPLGPYEDCSYMVKPVIAPGSQLDTDTSDLARQEQDRCQKSLASRRKVQQVDEAVQAVGLLLSGAVLVWLFNPRSKLTKSYL